MNAGRRSREHELLIRYLEEARPFFRNQETGPHPDAAALRNWLRCDPLVGDYHAIAAHLVFCDACYDLVLTKPVRRARARD